MIHRTESGIFPPVQLPSLEGPLFSVSVSPAADIAAELERYAHEDRDSWDEQAENALMFYRESFMTREDHARENIDWAIRNFGPPRPLRKRSPKRRDAFVRRIKAELSELRASGAIGNLILPEAESKFVARKIESGDFASPTEVLAAAMPFLRAERGKPKRADFLAPAVCPE